MPLRRKASNRKRQAAKTEPPGHTPSRDGFARSGAGVASLDETGFDKIVVLGMGHVGLPTALGFAELGWQVVGADSDGAKIARLKTGECPFYEPGLQELLAKHLAGRNFSVTEDVEEAIRSGPVLFLCVGTPQKENGQADLSQIEALVRTIARNLNSYKLIVEKSTVPAITAQWIKKTVARYAAPLPSPGLKTGRGSGLGNRTKGPLSAIFDVASNPEFLQEGKALENFFSPDRIVCGVESERARRLLESIYRPVSSPIIFTDLTTAELIKHAANAFLCTKISFMNMVADLCDAVGADVTKVAEGIGMDPRIGAQFLKAGIGFGGYCFPKDLRAFLHLAEEHSVDFSLLREVERINLRRIDVLLKKIRQALWVMQGKTIGVLGLAFKPGTDDIREAPSLKIMERLLAEGAKLRLHDPRAMSNTQGVFPQEPGRLEYADTPYEAARGADALLLLTEWEEYRELDLRKVRQLVAVPIIVDGRNMLDPVRVAKAGFEYICMGRGTAEAFEPAAP